MDLLVVKGMVAVRMVVEKETVARLVVEENAEEKMGKLTYFYYFLFFILILIFIIFY
jgi:hypothetical protein